MSRHKRVPDQEQEQEQDRSQELRGLGLWPLLWLIAVVIAIPFVVLGDPARGAEPAGARTGASAASENTADRW
ncbi:hypothetical protein GCM10010400_30550 [Streptomyces aculeolatus]|uniref:hypothetical protein n=1 Tax=Streptomyces aculeolatus TaxID=270689 RepID=UPI001CEC78CE|nr:hypothetical protein [Streptomyces aculeolatus]